MKSYNDAIGQHRIEETLSEVNCSFLTNDERKGSAKRHQMKNHRSSLLEGINEEENDSSVKWIEPGNKLINMARSVVATSEHLKAFS